MQPEFSSTLLNSLDKIHALTSKLNDAHEKYLKLFAEPQALGTRFYIKVCWPRNPKDLILLSVISQQLDTGLQVELEEKVKKLTRNPFLQDYEDKVFFSLDQRMIRGRLAPRIEEILSKMKVLLQRFPNPQKQLRTRGYRDHGTAKDISTIARYEAEKEGREIEEMLTQWGKSDSDVLHAAMVMRRLNSGEFGRRDIGENSPAEEESHLRSEESENLPKIRKMEIF